MTNHNDTTIDAGAVDVNPSTAIETIDPGRMTTISPGLARRLILATKSVEALTLDGKNDFHKYRYPTIGQVRAHANRALAGAGVSIMPSVVRVGRSVRQSAQGKPMQVTAVDLEIVVSSEDGFYVARWVGESEDTGDKGIQKAVSAGVKAFLAHMLLMPVGEEEDDDGTDEHARDPRRGKRTTHWIDNPKIRARFWAWATGELGLNERDVYTALGVQHMHEYAGTTQDAKSDIEKFIAAMSADSAPPQPENQTGEVDNA